MQMFQTLHRAMQSSGKLKVGCNRCRHEATFDHATAARTFGPDATPFDVRRRLVCSKCGERTFVRCWIG